MQVYNNGLTTPSVAPGPVYSLRLYVAGQTPKSILAFNNLKQICDEHLQRASRSSRRRPWSRNFRCRCAGSSATCRTAKACCSDSI